jgi:hypothetical protein
MHVPNRRWLASLFLLLPLGCASPGNEHEPETPPSEPWAAQPGQDDQAWLDQFGLAAARPRVSRRRTPDGTPRPVRPPAAGRAEPQDVQAIMQQAAGTQVVERRTATLVKGFRRASPEAGSLQQAHDDFASAYELTGRSRGASCTRPSAQPACPAASSAR